MKAFVTALLLALAWLPGAALAQSTPQAGRDYVEIPGGQAWAARPGRIEVALPDGERQFGRIRLEP